jgi:hypothetical protein
MSGSDCDGREETKRQDFVVDSGFGLEPGFADFIVDPDSEGREVQEG